MHDYTEGFFNRTLKLEQPSAKTAVKILSAHFKPGSVVDIGCGIGIYLKEFKKNGVEIFGVDGSHNAINKSLVGGKIRLFDLTKPLVLEKKYDLCLCIEVAEHLEEAHADTLISSLIKSCDIIIFTAATPGQGSEKIGHYNEQPHRYWIEKFSTRGFGYRKNISHKLRKEMKKGKIVWWVVKNLMVFKKYDS